MPQTTSSPELVFWNQLSRELEERDCVLYIASNLSQEELPDARILPAPRILGRKLAVNRTSLLNANEIENLLEISAKWDQAAWDQETYEHHALGFEAHFLLSKPELVLIWNIHTPLGAVMKVVAEKKGISTYTVERSPWPMLLTLYSKGSLLETEAYRKLVRAKDTWKKNKQTLVTVERYIELVTKSTSWWEQPSTRGAESIRKKYSVPSDSVVVVFIGQVDHDVQNFFYNPFFKDNLSALEAFLKATSKVKNLFIIGKHHPKSKISVEIYASALKDRGIWVDDMSIEDAFELTNHVVGVNSAALFEASLLGKSVMALGQTMLQSCGVFHVWDSESDFETTHEWLNEQPEERKRRQSIHKRALGYLLEEDLFYVGSASPENRKESVSRFAERISAQIRQSPRLLKDANSGLQLEDILQEIGNGDSYYYTYEAHLGRKVYALKCKLKRLISTFQ